ncbi:hypothetical protein GCM10009092_45280 [Bowmanella denitrificans]|uniref:Uncharacterized protein n=1 Tax=Bowmanella denitrificans TaxID=366582 RepID=A0ABN0XXK5_9ALTE
MDSADLVFMLVGGALILVGLVLFVFGRRDGNKNYLEGFGIKLDVSNPSIILIVAGVGLLLVPRLLPANKSLEHSAVNPQILLPSNTANPQSQAIVPGQSNVPAVTTANGQTQPVSPTITPTDSNVESVFLPQGMWQLSGYQESGIDVPGVQGNILFNVLSDVQANWRANLAYADIWGNFMSYDYAGQIRSANGQYVIDLLSSNDPGFSPQQNIPLEMMLENGGVLHMKYDFGGAQILLHYIQ